MQEISENRALDYIQGTIECRISAFLKTVKVCI